MPLLSHMCKSQLKGMLWLSGNFWEILPINIHVLAHSLEYSLIHSGVTGCWVPGLMVATGDREMKTVQVS